MRVRQSEVAPEAGSAWSRDRDDVVHVRIVQVEWFTADAAATALLVIHLLPLFWCYTVPLKAKRV